MEWAADDDRTARRRRGACSRRWTRDGTGDGYDLELLRAIADAVAVPVVASGGAGTPEHFAEALTEGRADAVLAASRWHDGDLTIREVKEHLASRGIPVRL